MKTFADWLEYYNNLAVGPFLEELEKMRGFYSGLGVDILKTLCVASGCVIAVSRAWNAAGVLRPRVVCAGKQGVYMRCPKGQ